MGGLVVRLALVAMVFALMVSSATVLRPNSPFNVDPPREVKQVDSEVKPPVAEEQEPSSEVLGLSSDAQPPVAGFGPGDFGGNGKLTGIIAGLIGAGIAWLIVGGAVVGVVLRRRYAASQVGFVPRIRPRR